jgi:hypothetical protein
VQHCVSSRLSKKTPRPPGGDVRGGGTTPGVSASWIDSLVTDSGHHLFKIKNITSIGQSVEPKYARFGGVRAPVWTVVIRENDVLRNVRMTVSGFCPRNRFHK